MGDLIVGVITNLLAAILTITLVAMDILAFFLAVRAASKLWPVRLLLVIDSTAKPSTDYYLQAAQRIWNRLTNRQTTEGQRLLIGFCCLFVARLMLSGFVQLLKP